ncbi:hypothetical protein [Leptolyngbya sp. PCC 6406]|uniref:hypothetical protein n=1 Tax=Leptolyngbya sp. PCC 6406 TaxID=1173264 RepID=UPI0002AC5A53|nr:hypothetical protein [Leptolyngbya sp. PCC 6406]
MVAPLCLIPTAVSELFARISATGQITLADRFGLMAAAFDESLSVEEREAIDRILQGIRRRRYQVVSDISALS